MTIGRASEALIVIRIKDYEVGLQHVTLTKKDPSELSDLQSSKQEHNRARMNSLQK